MKRLIAFLAVSAAWLNVAQSHSAAADVLTPCFLKMSLYTGIPGATVADLTADPSYPDSPAEVRYLRTFNTRDALPNDTLEDYGARITGFVTPSVSGDYYFFLRSERSAELWLGTDDTEASASLIAEELDYGDPFQEPDLGDTATSFPVSLVAGRRYFVMLLYKASSGGGASTDFAQVAWRQVDDFTPALDLKPIAGAYLSTLASDADAPSVSIFLQPTDVSVPQNSRVTFSVDAETTPTGPVCIQWQRNGVNLPDATGPSYTRYLDPADHGARFRAVVTVPGASQTSAEAAVTLTADATAPELTEARGGPNRPEVVLMFSEPLEPASAMTTSHYQISGPNGANLDVFEARLSEDGTLVTLITDAQTVGAEYTVTVSQVTDRATPNPNAVAAGTQATFHALGPWWQGEDGFVVFEAEDFDRNLDGLWFKDTERGQPSGGVAMVNPNGAGGNETTTKLEYDIYFTRTGTNYFWYRNSANDGNDDSVILHLDGARPPEREAGNLAAMSGFTSGLAGNYGWASSPFEGGGRMSFIITEPGVHSIGIARREDGAFVDKFVITTDPNFVPTTSFDTFGPPVTLRQGEPTPPGAGDFEFTLHPQNTAGDENSSITLTADADIPAGFLYTYQWQRQQGANYADIPGATLPSLTIDPLTLDWNGAVVRLRVTVSGVSKFSETATISVITETIPPEIVHVSASAAEPEVHVVFSEPVSTATASRAANYQISGPGGALPVTSVRVLPNNLSVVLTTGPQSTGTKYTLTVNGVTDTASVPNPIVSAQVRFYAPGALRAQGEDGLLVVEAERFDRNLDELWSVNLDRATPSGGASVVNPNGAGGSEGATKVEFDLEFTQTGTHIIWYRASSDSGNDDSMWLHLDGERPAERAAGNQASMSGFNGALEFVWRSDSQEGSDPMTFDLASVGVHTISFARREDGAYLDKFAITTDPEFNPNDYGPFGPPETREGIPPLPSLALASPAPGAEFSSSTPIPLAVQIGSTTRTLSKVEYFSGTEKIGESTQSPFDFSWSSPAAGTHSLTARLVDDTRSTVQSRPVTVDVTSAQDLAVTAALGPGGLILTWSGGAPPYTVQSKASLSDITWSDVLVTDETTATLPVQAGNAFLRIASP